MILVVEGFFVTVKIKYNIKGIIIFKNVFYCNWNKLIHRNNTTNI